MQTGSLTYYNKPSYDNYLENNALILQHNAENLPGNMNRIQRIVRAKSSQPYKDSGMSLINISIVKDIECLYTSL